MNVLLAASMTVMLLGANIPGAVAADVDPGPATFSCTPPLAVITEGPNGSVKLKSAVGVVLRFRPQSHTMELSRPGYDGSATLELAKTEASGKTTLRVTAGDAFTPAGESMVYVYPPGGSICPNGTPLISL
jgi:hypothetical protein